jgi:hypothetical protein
MHTALRILRAFLIILVVAVLAAVGTYFTLPPRASATKTFTVARPPETVFAFLASAPAGAQITKGVTQPAITSAMNNVVVAQIAFGDGSKGTATYTVTPRADGTQVALKMDHPLGASPLERVQAVTGGSLRSLVEAAAATITTQIASLKPAGFTGFQYSIVQVLAQPFFYIENCTSKESHDITAIVSQAVQAIPPLLHANHLKQDGPLLAIEPHVVQGQYCYQVGYRYIGAKPNALLFGKFGESPAGTALQVTYTGPEDKVVAEVYDRMDALLAATRLDDPTRTDDDWLTFEVYNDDPTQPGGSRNRLIYYLVPHGQDLTRLTALVPASPAATADAAPQGAPASAAPASAATP